MSPTSSLVATSATWTVLQNTENPAATVLLGAGLTHPVDQVRHSCLKSLIVRNSDAANMLILSHWSVYTENDYDLLREHTPQFAPAVRTLLSRGSMQIKSMMLSAVSELDLCDSVDVLIELAITPKHPLNQQAAECLLALCSRWGRAIRSGKTQDASNRLTLLNLLHNEIMRFPKSEVIMNAWLSVVTWEDGLQRSLISDSSQPYYSHMLRMFSQTTDPAALQLLAGYFWRSTTPPSIQTTICDQPNSILAIEMAKMVEEDNLEQVLQRLRVSKPLACLEKLDLDSIKLDKAVYRRLLLMMAASRSDASWSLRRSVILAKGSSAESRRLATEVLQWTRPVQLEKLIAIMQDDETNNGGKQALHDVHELMSWLSNPSVTLRKAAVEYFKNFNTDSLIRQISLWPARMCRIMAGVVAIVDKEMTTTLSTYLTSPAPKKRLTALSAVEYLGCTPQLRDSILNLLNDPKIEIRVKVIDTLAASSDESLLELIPKLLGDANTDVVDAATRAAKKLERQDNAKS